MDYKGVRILNELSLLEWKLVFSVPATQVEGKVFGGPESYFYFVKRVFYRRKKMIN